MRQRTPSTIIYINSSNANKIHFFPGLRALNVNGYASDVAGRLGDRPRVHIRDAEAAADDHIGFGQATDSDVSEQPRSADDQRAAHGGHRLRGDRAHL